MEKRQIHMVVTDLDGTFLSPTREISKEAVALIKKIRGAGVDFTFITGRPPYAMERFAQLLGITIPIACCNGAVIVRNGVVLKMHSFSLLPLLPAINASVDAGLTVLLYINGTEYALSKTAWVITREEQGRVFPLWCFDEHLNPEAEKVNIIANGSESSFANIIPMIKAIEDQYSVSFYGNSGCEVVSPQVDKGTALLELCNILNINKDYVLAIGDNANDNPMLLAAGVGAAVANAVDSTKAIADYCCAASNTDGVIEAIWKYVLQDD